MLPPEWLHSGVLSGGDDAVLAYAPLPLTSPSTGSPGSPIHLLYPAWSNKRIHSAGVTAILPISIPHPTDNAKEAHFYLTGSYDDTLRILSVPDGMTVRQPRVLHEIGLGGGVWRIKVLRSSTRVGKGDSAGGWEYNATLLVSCMYAGAKVVEIRSVAQDVSEGQEGGAAEWAWTSREVGRMEEHESMCYACDVQTPADADEDENGRRSNDKMVVSCSFYDKRLCLWEWPSPGA